MSSFTIGLPVYNAMPFLEESVKSLLRQTDGNFTILAIDDGSTDAGLEYLRSVKDSRLRVITQENRGLTFTLNRMLREAETPWLMRHDADDIALPDRVAVTRRYIERFPNAGMFYSEARYCQNGCGLGTFRTTRATPGQLRQITQEGYLLAICHPTVTLNIAKAIALGGYRFDLHIEDIDLWWRMALNHDIQYMPQVTTYFRHNTASVSTTNLECQSIHTLYVQYLLLSYLHDWPTLPLECVRVDLAHDVDRRRLACREKMRRANISYSRKQYVSGSKHLVRAALLHPFYFANRVLYELKPSEIAVNGENPLKFLGRRDKLWPQIEDPRTGSKGDVRVAGNSESVKCM